MMERAGEFSISNNSAPCLGLVFIHGAGLGAWVWGDVIKRLPFPSLAIHFPGRGLPVSMASATPTLEDYVSSAMEQLHGFAPQQLVLVCHSVGGLVGLDLAAQLGNRVAGFVALGAVIPPPGGSYLQVLPRGTQILMKWLINFWGTKPPDGVIKASLCADLGSEHTSQVVRDFVPESRRLYFDPTRYTVVPRRSLYIVLKYDQAVAVSLQRSMIARLRPQNAVELMAGHLAMLSEPDEVADLLRGYVRTLEVQVPEEQGGKW